MPNPVALQYGVYYHIFNRGNNRESIFVEERNYRHFLQLSARYVEPVADTYAYCLLRNHFHLLVRIKEEQNQTFGVSNQTPKVSLNQTPKVCRNLLDSLHVPVIMFTMELKPIWKWIADAAILLALIALPLLSSAHAPAPVPYQVWLPAVMLARPTPNPMHQGEATYYYATGAGACSFDPSPNDLMVAAMNPCPCGYHGDPVKECTCHRP